MSLPVLTDTHCHLDFPDFAAEIEAVVARAEAAGVQRMITISTRVKKIATYRALAERFANVWFSAGTHPHNAAEETEITLTDILAAADHPKCVAIGEGGWIFITTNPRVTSRPPRSGSRSRPRGKPACRW